MDRNTPTAIRLRALAAFGQNPREIGKMSMNEKSRSNVVDFTALRLLTGRTGATMAKKTATQVAESMGAMA